MASYLLSLVQVGHLIIVHFTLLGSSDQNFHTQMLVCTCSFSEFVFEVKKFLSPTILPLSWYDLTFSQTMIRVGPRLSTAADILAKLSPCFLLSNIGLHLDLEDNQIYFPRSWTKVNVNICTS